MAGHGIWRRRHHAVPGVALPPAGIYCLQASNRSFWRWRGANVAGCNCRRRWGGFQTSPRWEKMASPWGPDGKNAILAWS